jgi:hypothetical protein
MLPLAQLANYPKCTGAQTPEPGCSWLKDERRKGRQSLYRSRYKGTQRSHRHLLRLARQLCVYFILEVLALSAPWLLQRWAAQRRSAAVIGAIRALGPAVVEVALAPCHLCSLAKIQRPFPANLIRTYPVPHTTDKTKRISRGEIPLLAPTRPRSVGAAGRNIQMAQVAHGRRAGQPTMMLFT